MDSNLVTLRSSLQQSETRSAVVLVHGFMGHPVHTWEAFAKCLDGRLPEWDLFSFGYDTGSLRLWPRFGSRQPGLGTVATSLVTSVRNGLADYDRIAVVAFGEGGLVFQRAYLDGRDIQRRITHALLIAVPNTGLTGRWPAWGVWNRQIRDATHNSAFIRTLRQEWDDQVGPEPCFRLRVVAAESDLLASPDTARAGFVPQYCETLAGDHTSIIRPASQEADVLRLLDDLLVVAASAPRPRVFLSYAREDKDLVKRVYDRCRAEGFAPWMDSEDMEPGLPWQNQIDAALRDSGCMLVFVSRAGAQAVAKERFFGYEMSAIREMALSHNLALIPVRIDESEIPSAIGRYHAVDLSRDPDLTKLLRAVRKQMQGHKG